MVDLKSFWLGFVVCALGSVALLLTTAHAQPVELGGEDGSASTPARIQAEVEGGDWGAVRVRASSGQRISASLSLSEVTRVSFEADQVASVRAAQNGRPGSPVIEFERDDATGDLYVVVAEGLANQIVSTFVTTVRGHTYQIMWTIREQPASQLFVRGSHVHASGEGRRTGSNDTYQSALIAFAQHAFLAEPEGERGRRERVAEGVVVQNLGLVLDGDFQGHVFSVENQGEGVQPIEHSVFATSDTVAVSSAFDTALPGQSVRVVVIERRGADHE